MLAGRSARGDLRHRRTVTGTAVALCLKAGTAARGRTPGDGVEGVNGARGKWIPASHSNSKRGTPFVAAASDTSQCQPRAARARRRQEPLADVNDGVGGCKRRVASCQKRQRQWGPKRRPQAGAAEARSGDEGRPAAAAATGGAAAGGGGRTGTAAAGGGRGGPPAALGQAAAGGGDGAARAAAAAAALERGAAAPSRGGGGGAAGAAGSSSGGVERAPFRGPGGGQRRRRPGRRLAAPGRGGSWRR